MGLSRGYEPTEKEQTVYDKYFDSCGELKVEYLDGLTTSERAELATLLPGCSEKLRGIVGKALEPTEEPELPLKLNSETPEVSLANAFYVLNYRDMLFDEFAAIEDKKEKRKQLNALRDSYTAAQEYVETFCAEKGEEEEDTNKRIKLS